MTATMTASELHAIQHAKTEAVLTSIDATLATMTFGEFVALAIGETEARALGEMMTAARALRECANNEEGK